MANVEREDSRVHQETLRLNKYLAIAGVGSRRKNDELILSGAVKINGKVVQELGVKINPHKDKVSVNGQPVEVNQKSYYILLNKPKDCITTVSDERGRPTVMDYVRVRDRIYPVGRLDRNTTGVLLLTNDGELANGLIHPKNEIERVYRVRLESGLLDEDLVALKRGVRLEDGLAKPKDVAVIPGTKRAEIVLALGEGRNREVRRMFEELGYELKGLERILFAGLTTEGLSRGEWRNLKNSEVQHLRELAGVK
ncbi:MAG: rRNA pseudouridine synthase [Ignavibacteriales bacterium]|nr:rRNA pseudouridine synthase [Ignavibacteriales bacterium]